MLEDTQPLVAQLAWRLPFLSLLCFLCSYCLFEVSRDFKSLKYQWDFICSEMQHRGTSYAMVLSGAFALILGSWGLEIWKQCLLVATWGNVGIWVCFCYVWKNCAVNSDILCRNTGSMEGGTQFSEEPVKLPSYLLSVTNSLSRSVCIAYKMPEALSWLVVPRGPCYLPSKPFWPSPGSMLASCPH
jgi:hypothetical protein